MAEHMPKRTPSWTASDGTVHTSYIDSLKHNLRIILGELGENEVGAKNIVNRILENGNIDHMVDLMNAIKNEATTPTQFEVIVRPPNGTADLQPFSPGDGQQSTSSNSSADAATQTA